MRGPQPEDLFHPKLLPEAKSKVMSISNMYKENGLSLTDWKAANATLIFNDRQKQVITGPLVKQQ